MTTCASPFEADYKPALVRPSPNFAPRAQAVQFVVLHGTWMTSAQAALERLCSPAAQVSAHYVIDEAGQVYQLVAEQHVAWHAGKSQWAGVSGLNSCSIGIELCNPGDGTGEGAQPVAAVRPYTAAQYAACIAVLRDVLQRHALHPAAVVRHSDIAPQRKTDPGAHFDWARLVQAGVAVVR